MIFKSLITLIENHFIDRRVDVIAREFLESHSHYHFTKRDLEYIKDQIRGYIESMMLVNNLEFKDLQKINYFIHEDNLLIEFILNDNQVLETKLVPQVIASPRDEFYGLGGTPINVERNYFK